MSKSAQLRTVGGEAVLSERGREIERAARLGRPRLSCCRACQQTCHRNDQTARRRPARVSHADHAGAVSADAQRTMLRRGGDQVQAALQSSSGVSYQTALVQGCKPVPAVDVATRCRVCTSLMILRRALSRPPSEANHMHLLTSVNAKLRVAGLHTEIVFTGHRSDDSDVAIDFEENFANTLSTKQCCVLL